MTAARTRTATPMIQRRGWERCMPAFCPVGDGVIADPMSEQAGPSGLSRR